VSEAICITDREVAAVALSRSLVPEQDIAVAVNTNAFPGVLRSRESRM